jgi:cytochrome c oxidase cbb3-type subunit 3
MRRPLVRRQVHAWITALMLITSVSAWVGARSAATAAAAGSQAQTAPPAGRGAPAGRGGAQDPRSNVGPADRPQVDRAAADRGRAVWAVECVACHGAAARGGDKGPSLLRSEVVSSDRGGDVLGPFFKKGHPTMSGKPSASLTEGQVVDLLHFILQRRNDTLRGSALFTVQDILTGDPKAGAEYFNGAGKCASCHSVTGNLAGVAARIPSPVDLQQRMLFPTAGRGGRGGAAGRGGAPAPSATAVTVTLTPAVGEAMSGVLVQMDDFFVTFRDASGATRVVRRDRITDKNIHDLVAYLETLK